MRALRRVGVHERAPAGPPTLLPVLRPGDWSLSGVCVHRGLLQPQISATIPVIAVARPTPTGLDFVRRDALDELGMRWDELLRYATELLVARPTTLEVEHAQETTERPLMVRFDGDGVLTASHLVDPEVCALAHATIGSRILLAAVPSHRELYFADGSPAASLKHQRAFELWARLKHADALGVDALSPRAFVVRDGRVVGLFEPPA